MSAKKKAKKRGTPRGLLGALLTEDRKAFLKAEEEKKRKAEGHRRFMEKCVERLERGDVAILRACVRDAKGDRVLFTGFFGGIHEGSMVLTSPGQSRTFRPEKIEDLYEIPREDCACIVVQQSNLDIEFAYRLGAYVNPEDYHPDR